METNNFALYKGKIVYVPEVPEIPKRPIGCFDYVELDKRNYQLDLQSAIANGKEVVNEKDVRSKIENAIMVTGQLYPLQCEVVTYPACGITDCLSCRLVARVTFEQPEKKEGWPVIGTFEYDFEKGTEKYTSHVQPEAAGQEQEEGDTAHWMKKYEAASQQTASLQKQVEELRKAQVNVMEAFAEYASHRKDKGTAIAKINAWNHLVFRIDSLKALNPQDNQK